MAVGFVAHAVELQVGVAQTGFSGLLTEFRALSELNTVRRGLHRVVANLTRITNRVQEVGRQRRLATGELHRHLAARFDRNGVVEHRLDVFPRQFMHEPDLVRVHEAGIAHHVAAVGQIDRQHRATPVGDRRRTVVVELVVIVGADVAAREDVFQVLAERRIDRHQVVELAMDRAFLLHDDLAVFFNDARLDFAALLIEKDFHRHVAVDNLITQFRNALRAERIGLARPTQRGLLLFVALQQRLVGPLRGKRRVLADLVQPVENLPGDVRRYGDSFFHVFDGLVHMLPV